MLIPPKNQPEKDVVMTPPELARAIIDYLPLEGKVLDPSRGKGAFYDQFPEHLEKHYCEISEGKDFFDFHKKVDWIVTNPPWSKYRDFSIHAYQISDNVAYLNGINHDVGLKARLRDMDEYGFGLKEIILFDSPKNFPQSGFQLGVCWKQRGYKGLIKLTKIKYDGTEHI